MSRAGPGELSPAVESDSPEERIAARRLRIAARTEARTRLELGEEAQEQEENTEEPRTSQKQVDQSEKRMLKLQTDGTELVTNILVAADARETKRRAQLAEARRLRNEKLENEAKSSLEKFEEVTQNWPVAKAKEIPQDLRDALKSQQQLCMLITEDKNKLINELQHELKSSDDRYVKELKKQAEDVDLMREKMQEQMTSLMKLYRQELDLIENSFDDERKTLLTSNLKKWEQQRKERSDRELEHLLQRIKQKEENEVLLHRLRVADIKEYNMMKLNLETQSEILQQNIQKTKATNQLNQEKLEYSRHVITHRKMETIHIESLQRKRILRLQDSLKNLKVKCASQEKQAQEENQSLTDGYKRSMLEYKDMQKHLRHFAAVDAERFEEIWLMNENEAKALVHKVLETDRVIYEQFLGLAWAPPHVPFMENSGPIQPQHQAQRTAQQFAMQALGEVEEKREMEGESSTAEVAGLDRRTVKKLLELLCDETGFLIESKLLKLLSPLEKDPQSFIKLHLIFSALGIENEEDVYKMAEFFEKYKQQQKDQPEEGISVSNENELVREMDSELVHPNHVVKALHAFTAQYCRPRDLQSQKQSSVLSLEERDDSEDAAYWESMANVIPESKLKVWNALEDALSKYHTVLTERSKILTDTHHLKQQNAELTALLHQYLSQKGNTELKIPPTLVMQLTSE
ncbi:dynein regulatory complex protein 1-like [Astyanax mexicanus]|uniref:Dynein regulatory complex protein 1 n=1 Tax=Astyanax mexicanus TaxID=7994 RepID=A0A8B9JMI2_ASTMX|nr:dynein regulatory complex protein 1-like [Astyanax mexicanus]